MSSGGGVGVGGGSRSTGYMDATAAAVDHCETMAREHPDLAAKYYEPIASFCKDKLWHQMTMKILDFVTQPATAENGKGGMPELYLSLYDRVVLCVDSKLNPLSLARIAAAVANALVASDITAAKAILENLLANNKKEALGTLATVYVESKLALLQLQQLRPGQEQDASQKEMLQQMKRTMKRNESILQDELAGAGSNSIAKKKNDGGGGASASGAAAGGSAMTNIHPPVDQALVYAMHYEQAMTYYKVVGPPEAFYQQAMHFLNYAPPPPPPKDDDDEDEGGEEGAQESAAAAAAAAAAKAAGATDYHQLAVDLVLAALTGDGVYNLGQVLEQQKLLLAQLRANPSSAWLVELLRAAATGNVVEMQSLSTQKYAAQIARQPVLVHCAKTVEEKVTLLALVHLVFEKASHERTLSFEEIGERLRAPEDRVEWIVMRALSVGLIEGKLDQVDRAVKVTAVMPRTLDPAQMQSVADRFLEWADKVHETKLYMQEQTPTFA